MGECDGYTRMLQMNAPFVYLTLAQNKFIFLSRCSERFSLNCSHMRK